MLILVQRFRKYIENAFWLIFEKGFTLFTGMVVGIYVARYLRPEAYGLLSYTISFVSVFAAVSTLGLDQVIVRELARAPHRKEELLGTGFVLKLVGSVVLTFLMVASMFFMGHDAFTNSLIMVVALGEVFKAFEVVNYLFQSQVKSKPVVQLQIVINIVLALLKVGLVFMRAPLIWFAVVIPVGTALNAVGYVKSYRDSHGSPWRWFFRKDLAFTLLRESWPLALYGIALNIQARIDQVMLGKLMTNYEVGQYSVALKMIEIFGFIPMVLMNTFTPAVTRAKIEGEELYRDRLVNLYRLMFFAFLLTAIPLYLFAEDIIVLLYGFEYQAAGYLLSLFALRLFFSNMGVGKSVFIVNESLFKYSLLTVVIGACSNIALNYLLIPLYGMEGAIVASMLSFTISIFMVDLFFRATRMNQRLMFRGMLTFWKLNNAR